METNDLKSCQNSTPSLVQLEPLVHQVGGHSSMLSLDEETICKPLVSRELRFYQTLPDAVRRFTPSFYGIIQVRIEQEDEGYVTLVATPPQFYRPKSTPKLSRIRLRRSGSIEIESAGSDEGVFEEVQENTGRGGASRRLSSSHNPWSLRCHRDNLQAFLSSDSKTHLQNFILLENLTSRFALPCVLDLKMGTRQYSDLATPAKRKSKMAKSASTTSGKLGLRLGGMQVYQVTTKHYLCRNKFHGRELNVNGFERTLYQFLHNGKKIRKDIIPILVRKLEELSSILEQQEAFRFYTSSLLLIYDGESVESRRSSVLPTSDLNNKDLVSKKLDVMGRSMSADGMSYVTRKSYFERSHSLQPSNFDLDDNVVYSDESIVDVRIIDFAHSTHKGLGDPIQYTGPDQGFLFGLENLLSILKNIETMD